MNIVRTTAKLPFTTGQKMSATLRIAVAMCFIGHGAFGIITKPVWCNYFAVFGIGKTMSYQLMPLVGGFDILLGLLMLLYPLRIIPAWLVVWGLVTALLRPLSGEHFAEFIERAGNYGAPLALLLLTGIPKTAKEWFTRIDTDPRLSMQTANRLNICLRVAGFLLFLGHGWLNLVGKKGLLLQYSSLGFGDPSQVATIIGSIEILAAFVILVKPFRELLLVLFLWKMLSETFYASYPVFEWIERGGSYGVLLALYFFAQKSYLSGVRQLKPTA